MPPGEYICRRYARTMFRGATRTILVSSWRERRTANRLGDTDIRPFFRKRGGRSGTPGEGRLVHALPPRRGTDNIAEKEMSTREPLEWKSWSATIFWASSMAMGIHF